MDVHVDNLMLIAKEGPKLRILKLVPSLIGLAQNYAVSTKGKSSTSKCRTALKKITVNVCSVMFGCMHFFKMLYLQYTSLNSVCDPYLVVKKNTQNEKRP